MHPQVWTGKCQKSNDFSLHEGRVGRANVCSVSPQTKPLARVLATLAVVLLAVVAVGQPKKDKSGRKDEAETSTTPDAGAADPKPQPGDDLGPPPPKGTETQDAVPKSPLNPAANEFPDGGAKPPPPEYDKLLGEIAALRGRVASLTTTLFASKLRVVVETDDHDDARITKLVITLDDGVIYTAPARFTAEDGKIVYEHAVAPGHHTLGIEVERSDARGKEFQSWQATKTSIIVPESKLLLAEILVEDDSDMAEDFPDDQDGEYELNVRVRAQVDE